MCNNCNVILAAAMAKAGRQDICLASKEASNQRAQAGRAKELAGHLEMLPLGPITQVAVRLASWPCSCVGWLQAAAHEVPMALSLSCFAPRKAFATREQPHAACLTSSLTPIRSSVELAEEQAEKLPADHMAGLP